MRYQCANPGSCVKMQEELNAAYTRIAELEAQLAAAQRQNPLTGLPNKVALEEDLAKAIRQKGRNKDALYQFVFFADLDNFKNINDTYSHEFGDECLKAVAEAMKSALRETDAVYHISGDEFVIIASCTCNDHALIVREKIQTAIVAVEISYKGETVQLGMSVGLAPIYIDSTVKAVLEGADQSLQKNKRDRAAAGLRISR